VETMPFQPLIEKMCEFFPEDRPTLSSISQEFHTLLRKYDYQKVIADAIAEKRLNDARTIIKDLQESQHNPVFFCPPSEIYRFSANVALSETNPDYQRAIDQLGKALSFEPHNLAIHLQLARAYKQFTSHPQYLLLSETSYSKAAALSSWQPELVLEWLSVLEQLPAHKRIEQTVQIPWELRSPLVFTLRINGFLELQHYDKAWNECVAFFENFRFDQQIYDSAQKVAENIPPLELVKWKHQHQGAEKLFALLSIIWARNGNMELATQCFARAIELWQESEE
jgi:tetratricopeptide (TPR) repeat protein